MIACSLFYAGSREGKGPTWKKSVKCIYQVFGFLCSKGSALQDTPRYWSWVSYPDLSRASCLIPVFVNACTVENKSHGTFHTEHDAQSIRGMPFTCKPSITAAPAQALASPFQRTHSQLCLTQWCLKLLGYWIILRLVKSPLFYFFYPLRSLLHTRSNLMDGNHTGYIDGDIFRNWLINVTLKVMKGRASQFRGNGC